MRTTGPLRERRATPQSTGAVRDKVKGGRAKHHDVPSNSLSRSVRSGSLELAVA